MPIYAKESLETLRRKINLVQALEPYLDLKKAGASYKALCPFHDEKTPSFMVQQGDSHYHCFGCGAHGDAIQFLMEHQKMPFHDAVESLASRFQVHMETVEKEEAGRGISKSLLYNSLELASSFYHAYLLHTEEGHCALQYLYNRGITLPFIQDFQIGLAPKESRHFFSFMRESQMEVLIEAGLARTGERGGNYPFFSDRITFPILDHAGRTIGFSARKYREDTFGGKYINTPETPLFKKSRVLFGLHYCRRRIAKERRVVVVEGQIDCLKLIHEGLNMTVCGQGTAFGEGQVADLLKLGVHHAYLVMDSDRAGEEAARKIGNLFQKGGAEVTVVRLPAGSDPDSFLSRNGISAFLDQLEMGDSYLDYLVYYYPQQLNIHSPSGKNELIQTIAGQIRNWDNDIMVRESLKKVAHILQVPEEMVGVDRPHHPNVYIPKRGVAGPHAIDPDLVMETDFLRWLLKKPELLPIGKQNLQPPDLLHPACQKIYQAILRSHENHERLDLMNLMIKLEEGTEQEILSTIGQKKINIEKYKEGFGHTVQQILTRNWMRKREDLSQKIVSFQSLNRDTEELLKEFDDLKKNPPQMIK